jgi:hypothetical protein
MNLRWKTARRIEQPALLTRLVIEKSPTVYRSPGGGRITRNYIPALRKLTRNARLPVSGRRLLASRSGGGWNEQRRQ